MLAAQADGTSITTIEGLATNGELPPDAEGVPGEPRPAVRLLHAGHGDGGGRLLERTRTRPRRRCARASRATCAAAPATTTSCSPCSPRRRGAEMTVARRRPAE
jgi:hypothetical protein